MPRRPGEANDRLDSWKEIAAYLGREVRTVQGWEKNEGLPVHRHQHAKIGSVYAFRSELDVWQAQRKALGDPVIETPAELVVTPRKKPVGVVIAAALTMAVAVGFFVWRTRPSTPPEGIPSIVVLPFLDLSPQKDQEYFSDGLTEEIIDALSKLPNLRVVARTSAFAFKGKATDIRQIGQQLNVAAVLEGSVRKSGDQLRITAQLNRVSDGYHLWSQEYDRQLRDVFAVQQEISQAIADRLRVGQQVARQRPTEDLEAYRLYQEGKYFFNQHHLEDGYPKAIARYQEAIGRDPKFAMAYAGIADAYAYQAENFMFPPKQVMPKAKEAAERAVALDPNSSEAHTSLAIVKLDYEWDWQAADRELKRAMQLNPGSGYARHWYAHSLEARGRLSEAMQEMREAEKLDPLSMPIAWDIAAELVYYSRRYDEGLRHLNKATDLFPDVPILWWFKAEVQYRKGDRQAGHEAMEKMKSLMPPSMAGHALAEIMAAHEDAYEGRRAEVVRTLQRLESLREKEYVDAVLTATLCRLIDDRERVVTWLQRAYEDHSTLLVYAPLQREFRGVDERVDRIFSRLHMWQ